MAEGEDLDMSLTIGKFNDLIREELEKCLIPIDDVLREAEIDKLQIDEVILVGGSTRITHF